MLVTETTSCIWLIVWLAIPASPSQGSSSPTSIFDPASTPARSIYGLSMFVFAVTAVIFVVVFSLLVYTVIKFRQRDTHDHHEPPQVYGSTQVEMAWTVIPIYIVLFLFLATARVIHGIQDTAKPAEAIEVTVVG